MPLGRTRASRSGMVCLLPRTICFSRPVSLAASKSSPAFAHEFVPHSFKHTCLGCSGCCVNTSAPTSPGFSQMGSFTWISHDKCTAMATRKPEPMVPCKLRETLLLFVRDLKEGINQAPHIEPSSKGVISAVANGQKIQSSENHLVKKPHR